MNTFILNTSQRLSDARSARYYDRDGYLHVNATPITKEQVVSYYGHEIANSHSLGLEPSRMYKFLRPADELQKAAKTFNGMPLKDNHHEADAKNPGKSTTIGSVGTNTHWSSPYLVADITIWDGNAIKRIENGQQKELSANYYSQLDMTPGTFKGQHYDGVIRHIVGSHVALVPEGRAGSDVKIKDSKMADDTDPKAGMPKVFADMVYGLQQFCGDQSQDWCREMISKCIAEGNASNKNLKHSDARRLFGQSDDPLVLAGDDMEQNHVHSGYGWKDGDTVKEPEKKNTFNTNMLKERASAYDVEPDALIKELDRRGYKPREGQTLYDEKTKQPDGNKATGKEEKENEMNDTKQSDNSDKKEDKKEKKSMSDKDTKQSDAGDGMADFYNDMKKRMGDKSITADECIKHCQEAVRKASGDGSKDAKTSDAKDGVEDKPDDKKEVEDAKCDDKKKGTKHSDAALVMQNVDDILEARQVCAPVLGQTKLSDARSIYTHAAEKQGYQADDLIGAPLNTLKAMVQKEQHRANTMPGVILSDSAPANDFADILPKKGV